MSTTLPVKAQTYDRDHDLKLKIEDDVQVSKDSLKAESESRSVDASESCLYDAAFEKKTLRYIDWCIIPICVLSYSFCLIDRMTPGGAYTAGMGVDLALNEGERYNIVTFIYFVPYILLQLPGSLILRRLGVRNLLSFVMLAWGVVSLCAGFVKSWAGYAACRVLSGIFQAPFSPALFFLISTWYKRYEVQKRVTLFTQLSSTASGLAPLFAYVLSLLDGKGGLAGWRWIFIIEALITILLSAAIYFFIPEFPDRNRFLTREQTDFVLKRINEDRGDALPDVISWAKIKVHLSDWKVWVFGFLFALQSMPAYAQIFFLPIILTGMGWSRTHALLLSVPPYGPTIIVSLVISYYSDKYRHRSSFMIGGSMICIVGLALTAFAKQNAVRYFGAFLTNAGNVGSGPSLVAYTMNNVVSHSKRSVVTAITLSFASIGAVIAANIFRSADYPRYLSGLITTIASQVFAMVIVVIMTLYMHMQNKRSREGRLAQPIEGTPGFLYTL
ncbi:major facilitator superfamily domain-containing protein [Panaeolus papilionaceus]|nr:major facilitator superfamily domain-containing protein [Panaeolus papilionaceus]